MLRRILGFSYPRTQKSFPKEAISLTSQEGYSPSSRDCEANAIDADASTNLRGSHPLYAKKLPEGSYFFDVPGGIRTPDRRLRRPLLYPAELLRHGIFQAKMIISYVKKYIKCFILSLFSYMIFGGRNVFFFLIKVMLEYQKNSENRSIFP